MDGGLIPISEVRDFHVTTFAPWHLRSIALQPGQAHLGTFLNGSDLPEKIAEGGPGWTAIADGKIIGCAGFREEWTGRSSCWATLSDHAGKHMTALTRAVRKALNDHPAERIETTVLDGFEPGLRWVRMLGFEEEGLRKRYCRGEDHRAFALLKPTVNGR